MSILRPPFAPLHIEKRKDFSFRNFVASPVRPPKSEETPGKTTKGDRGDDISYLKVLESIKALPKGVAGWSAGCELGVTHATTRPLRPPHPASGTSLLFSLVKSGDANDWNCVPRGAKGTELENRNPFFQIFQIQIFENLFFHLLGMRIGRKQMPSLPGCKGKPQ